MRIPHSTKKSLGINLLGNLWGGAMEVVFAPGEWILNIAAYLSRFSRKKVVWSDSPLLRVGIDGSDICSGRIGIEFRVIAFPILPKKVTVNLLRPVRAWAVVFFEE